MNAYIRAGLITNKGRYSPDIILNDFIYRISDRYPCSPDPRTNSTGQYKGMEGLA